MQMNNSIVVNDIKLTLHNRVNIISQWIHLFKWSCHVMQELLHNTTILSTVLHTLNNTKIHSDPHLPATLQECESSYLLCVDKKIILKQLENINILFLYLYFLTLIVDLLFIYLFIYAGKVAARVTRDVTAGALFNQCQCASPQLVRRSAERLNMPPFEKTQHPKPFKQRKSLGMCLYIIQTLDDLMTNCQI